MDGSSTLDGRANIRRLTALLKGVLTGSNYPPLGSSTGRTLEMRAYFHKERSTEAEL